MPTQQVHLLWQNDVTVAEIDAMIDHERDRSGTHQARFKRGPTETANATFANCQIAKEILGKQENVELNLSVTVIMCTGYTTPLIAVMPKPNSFEPPTELNREVRTVKIMSALHDMLMERNPFDGEMSSEEEIREIKNTIRCTITFLRESATMRGKDLDDERLGIGESYLDMNMTTAYCPPTYDSRELLAYYRQWLNALRTQLLHSNESLFAYMLASLNPHAEIEMLKTVYAEIVERAPSVIMYLT